MFRKILVAFDGSEPAETAFRTGLDLAGRLGAELLVFAVARPPEPSTRVELEAVLDYAKEHFEAAFARLRGEAAGRSVPVRTETAIGHPAQQIVQHAEAERVDLIVVGNRGLTLVQRWMLGSVSERVIRHAHCPVLVVR